MEAGLAEDVISGGITSGRCLNLEREQGPVPAGAETGSVEPWSHGQGPSLGLAAPQAPVCLDPPQPISLLGLHQSFVRLLTQQMFVELLLSRPWGLCGRAGSHHGLSSSHRGMADVE